MKNRERLMKMALIDTLHMMNLNLLELTNHERCILEVLRGRKLLCISVDNKPTCYDCIAAYLNKEERK